MLAAVRARCSLFLLGCWLIGVLPAQAVLFISTADPEHNTQEPQGELAGSGWQWQGQWQFFLGTVVSSNCFLTARHVGGRVGDDFVFRGVPYRTLQVFDDPAGDLRLWRVCGQFPDFAPLFEGTQEKGRPIVVFGRGTQRGPAVFAPQNPTELRGWLPGTADGRWRWGTNLVTEVLKIDPESWAVDFLVMDFNQEGGGDEAFLSGGDSGGGVFIQDAGVWKLAGINHAVDGPFNSSTNGPGYVAALFDARGFYYGGTGGWELVRDSTEPVPAAFYSTRIAGRLSWIRESMAQPLPAGTEVVLLSAPSPSGPFVTETAAVAGKEPDSFEFPLSGDNRFFRLSSLCPRRVVSVTVENRVLRLKYE